MILEATADVRAADRARLWGLLGIGLASALLYWLGITARYPLAIGLQHPRASWTTLVGYALKAGFAHAGVYAVLIIGYVLALRLALRLEGRAPRVTTAVVVCGWLLASAALFGAYPGESLDIFDYVFRGRMMVELGASPLAVAPSAFADQPFYAYITWRGQVDTYGPVWEYASGAVAWVVHHGFGRGDSQIAYVVGYRLLAVLAAGLCGLLVALLVRRANPEHAGAALLAWLWNPLVIITSAIGAHNDLVMMLGVLAALLLLQRQRWVWGLLALILAAHVKLTALLLLPIVGLWLARRRGWPGAFRACALAIALTIPLSWLLYAPLGRWATLPRMLHERARLLVNSPADLVYRMLQERYFWAEPAAWRATTLAATAVFFVIAAGVLIWFWRHAGARPQLENNAQVEALDALLWRGCITITFVYLLIGSFWFQHWYLLWLLAPVALLPAGRWALTLLPAYCLGALWSDLASSFLRGLPTRPFNATQIGAFNVLAQLAPLLCVLLITRIWLDAPRLWAAAGWWRSRAQSTVSIVASTPEMDHRP